MRSLIFSMLVGLLVLVPMAAFAGDLDSSAEPSSGTTGKMFNLEDIYNRLDTGAEGSLPTTAAPEPATGPAANTTHTLNDVMKKAPAKDDTNGAKKTDVANGKTFWGLNQGAGGWGLQTGTGSASGGGGSTAGVPKTGQTSTVPIDPAPTGSDGALGKGVAWPDPRFTDNSNGTVTDNLTGLIWLKNAQCSDEAGGVTPSSGKLDWADALTWCNAMKNGKCGLTDSSVVGDWRLPNARELYSLIDLRYSNPAVSNRAGDGKGNKDVADPDGDPFNNLKTDDYYWTSSTFADDTSYAWYVHLNGGYVYSDDKTYTYYVLSVRGGQ